MKFFSSLVPCLPGACVLSVLVSGTAVAQTRTLESLLEKARVALEENRWQEALDLNNRAIELHGKSNPLRTFGAQFGTIYYRKGLCEMKLKKWQEAAISFEICYRDFPNSATTGNGNLFQKMALLKWGEAAMGAEKWELAISRFSKFIEERDRARDIFPQGSFHINSAICHYKLGHLAEGNENLEIAIRNKQNFPTPETGIVAGFQELVSTAVGARNESPLLDFIAKNRGELTIDPAEMRRFNGVFLRLAGDALSRDLRRSAIAIYQFVPPSSSFAADSPDCVKLAAVALIHEKCGNLRGALAAYRQLEDDYPASPNRDGNLYQLVRVASMTGELDLARDHALRLFRDFPESPHLAELRAIGVDFSPGEIAASPAVKAGVTPEEVVPPLPVADGFSAAIDLYQGRKYIEAKTAFGTIRARAESGAITRDIVPLAVFYEAETLRKLGDFEGLAQIPGSIGESPLLGPARVRQLEINAMWVAVGRRNWEQVESLAGAWTGKHLPGDQRAQVACCRALALENLGRPFEALDAFNIAMTADAGASEDVARMAALGVMRIHKADPEIQALLGGESLPEETPPSPARLRLGEAASVAGVFEISLGAGVPLPAEFRAFLKR